MPISSRLPVITEENVLDILMCILENQKEIVS
jgi:hypothetical protein